jgi:hypothetical protein
MDRYLTIPGLLHQSRCRVVIEEVIPLLPDSPTVLEIGSFLGKSTNMWLDKLPDNAILDINDSFKIPNIEIRNLINTWIDGDYTELLNFLDNGGDQFSLWKMHTDSHPRSHLIRNTYHMRTDDLLLKSTFDNNYDCVFLDGNHHGPDVLRQLEYFKDCDIICGDDFELPYWANLVNSVTEFANQNNRVLNHKHGLFWLTKQ